MSDLVDSSFFEREIPMHGNLLNFSLLKTYNYDRLLSHFGQRKFPGVFSVFATGICCSSPLWGVCETQCGDQDCCFCWYALAGLGRACFSLVSQGVCHPTVLIACLCYWRRKM